MLRILHIQDLNNRLYKDHIEIYNKQYDPNNSSSNDKYVALISYQPKKDNAPEKLENVSEKKEQLADSLLSVGHLLSQFCLIFFRKFGKRKIGYLLIRLLK